MNRARFFWFYLAVVGTLLAGALFFKHLPSVQASLLFGAFMASSALITFYVCRR